MPSASVITAVETYLAANFATLPVYTVNTELEPPPDGSGFVQVQFPFGREEQRSIGDPGNNWFREEGAIRFVLSTPIGEGIAAAATIADELRTLMRNKRFDGVRTYEAQPIVIDDRSDKPGYLVTAFAVAYDFDITA
jgi:hypothetical protein